MAAEQELTSANPAAVAKLTGIHELEREWLSGYAEGAIALREEVEAGAVAQANFIEISARTIGKEKFDAIRTLLSGIAAKFEAADDFGGRFLMQAITLDLVNMETGQRGFLLTGEDASLDPFNQGQVMLASDIQKLRVYDYAAAGVSASEIDGIQAAVNGWKEAAAQPEIDARIEVRNFPKDMGDVIALVNSGIGKQSMDVIRADLGAFLESELALNVIRADEVEAQASSARTMGIGIAAASITIMMVIGFFLSRSITTPLVQVAKVASDLADRVIPSLARLTRAVAGGDLTLVASVDAQRVEINSKDEIGEMAGSFNTMIDQLEGMGDGMNEMVGGLRTLVVQLGGTANGLVTASSQLEWTSQQAGQSTQGISATTEQLAAGAQQQAEGVDTTTTAMGQLSRAIDQIAKGSQEQAGQVKQASIIVGQVSAAVNAVAESAQSASSGSQEATEAARAGAEMVEKTVEGIQKIETAVTTASDKITELGIQSAEISKIVTVIDGIAAQTNLLALNAAIEAARAGEQGRGFAVVADEVRKLAERVTDATKEIANLIDTVQKGVDESIKATEGGAREVSEGAVQAEEAGKILDQILASVEAVSGQIEQISAAAEEVSASSDEMMKTIESVSAVVEQNSAVTEQMTANSEEVLRSIEGVAGITQQSSAAAQEMSASAEQMTAQVQEVMASSESLADMAQSLQQAVAMFQVDRETSAMTNGSAQNQTSNDSENSQAKDENMAMIK